MKNMIELTDEEGQLFLKFRQYQDVFTTLVNSGLFAIKRGQAVINFDEQGTLCDIKISTTPYDVKKTKSVV